jgi:Na+/melibiose symporter-like transporter
MRALKTAVRRRDEGACFITSRPMRIARTVELCGGIATALLGAALSLYVMRPAETPSDYLSLFSLTTCAALLVGVGAYADAVSRIAWGRVPVWVGGAILIYKTSSLLVHVPVGLYFLGRVGLFLILPGVTAAVTLIASLFSGAPTKK